LRRKVERDEQVAVGAGVSVWTVKSWDYRAYGDDVIHQRTPSDNNCIRLSDFAKALGLSDRVVAALRPAAPDAEARA
jgi:hypothetical protein